MLDRRIYQRLERIWDYGERLAAIWAADPGSSQFGRYRGQPLAAVGRNSVYMDYLQSRWEAGLPDPPEMIAALRRPHQKRSQENRISVTAERCGDCTVLWPGKGAHGP
jgi:hypothetical protein